MSQEKFAGHLTFLPARPSTGPARQAVRGCLHHDPETDRTDGWEKSTEPGVGQGPLSLRPNVRLWLEADSLQSDPLPPPSHLFHASLDRIGFLSA